MNTPKRDFTPGMDLMGLVLVVWLCALPFIGLLIAPFLGITTAIIVAALLLIVMLMYCWGNCILLMVQVYREKLQKRHKKYL